MRRLMLKLWDVQGSLLSCLALLSALFLIGVVTGTAVSSNIVPDGELESYISDYVASSQTSDTGRLTALAFINAFKYHLPVILFGFTALGVVFVPAIVFVRAFFLSFAVTSFIKALGSGGFLTALGIFGPPLIISLPCLLILGSQSFSLAVSIMKSGSRGFAFKKMNPQFLARTSLCLAALVLSALFEAFLTPRLIAVISDIIW